MPQLTLHPALWAHLEGVSDDVRVPSSSTYVAEDERAQSIADTLAQREGSAAVWVFAYGSLIWKPGFVWEERRVACLPGWTRAFCLKTVRWRGTPEHPGLVMGLVPGGECRGIAYRLNPATMRDDLDKLWRRELAAIPANYDPRWVRVNAETVGPVQALAFTVNPGGCSYLGVRPPAETASLIAAAIGAWGACAEYLYETVLSLEATGIHDHGLWELQDLVAAHLLLDRSSSRRANTGPPDGPRPNQPPSQPDPTSRCPAA